MIKKINKIIILYILLTFIFLGLFLYVRFPGRAVQSYLLDTIAERYPEASLSLASVSLSFPPGLKLEDLRLGFKDKSESELRLEILKVRPRLTGYLFGNTSLAMTAVLYGGSLQGRVNYAHLVPDKTPASAELKLENLNLEKILYLKEKLGRQLSGKFSGAFQYGGESRLDFEIQNGSYQLLDKLFGFDRLDFSKAEGQIELRGGVLKLNKLKLLGDKIKCSLKGDIVLNPEFKNSEINLTGTMELGTINSKPISLSITGTVGNAKTRYL
jgi:type II secretion system protein N